MERKVRKGTYVITNIREGERLVVPSGRAVAHIPKREGGNFGKSQECSSDNCKNFKKKDKKGLTTDRPPSPSADSTRRSLERQEGGKAKDQTGGLGRMGDQIAAVVAPRIKQLSRKCKGRTCYLRRCGSGGRSCRSGSLDTGITEISRQTLKRRYKHESGQPVKPSAGKQDGGWKNWS